MLDKYENIVNKLIAQMETVGANDWQMPWDLGVQVPHNALTEHSYTGINRLMLGFDAMLRNDVPIYATYKQWQELGYQVRKGEKSQPVLRPIQWTKKNTDENGEKTDEDIIVKKGYRFICVFHHSQVDGYEVPVLSKPQNKVIDNDSIEQFIKNTGVIVTNGTKASYTPLLDYITMPPKQAFKDNNTDKTATDGYYSTLLHELVHWTGNHNRLNRNIKNKFGSKDYAIEELVAEIGASFLCQDLGLNKAPRTDHAQYLKNWLKGLKNDLQYIVKASGQAQQAVQYLHSLQPKQGA